MHDVISIHDLRVRAILGVNDWERRNKQEICINLKLHVDTRAAGASDRIEEAVNYRTVAKRIIHIAESSEFGLVERLASVIAETVIREFGVERVEVDVQKPGALRFARSVGVTIVRSADDYPA